MSSSEKKHENVKRLIEILEGSSIIYDDEEFTIKVNFQIFRKEKV